MSEQAQATPPSAREALAWIGCQVDDISGTGVGQAHALFVDVETGEPTCLVVRPGRFGGSLVVVPLHDCAAAAGSVWVAQEREAIRTAPVVDPTRPLLREHELTICAHYGVGERVGRAAEVASRGEGSITSRPA